MTSASGLPPSSASNSWLGKVRSKFGHVRDFFASYVSGVKLFGQEVRVATRLAFRVYGQGKRSSRLERLHMRQSFGDLVRVLPLAGLFLVFGLELTTMAILRYMPALLPRAMRLAVVPAAQKLGVAPASNVDASARRRLALCTDLVQGARAVAAAAKLSDAEALLARVEDGGDGQHVSASEIRAVAAAFADECALSLDKLPKTIVMQVCLPWIAMICHLSPSDGSRDDCMQLAELHLPSGVTVPGPDRLSDMLGAVSGRLTPTLVPRRRLRECVRRLMTSDGL